VLAALQHSGDDADLADVGLQGDGQLVDDIADEGRVDPVARRRASAALPRSVVPPRSGGVFY
jgi:hypothetical protein